MEAKVKERALERIDIYNPSMRRSVMLNYHPRGHAFSYHTHDFYEINYVTEGRITEVVSGESHPMVAGDAVLMHPGVFHGIRDDADATVLNILIRPRWLLSALAEKTEGALGKFASTAREEEYTEYLVFHGASVEEEVAALMRETEEDTPCSRLAAEGACLMLLAHLSRSADEITVAQEHNGTYRRFAAILSYLYENSATATVSAIANRFGYSPAHLTRLCRRYTDEAPITLLKQARLAHAAALLCEGDAPVHRIAAEAGFPCAPYFHRLFKATYGVTPEEYRTAKKAP
jgi:AraC-like DNA-binding protein/mannose-6-phosphate isomerase-like protein (cupin superfamily)